MQFLETYKQSWKTLAKAFPEIQYWEVGNETNHNPFLHPTTYTTRKTTFSTEEKAQITVDMVYYAAMGIREANPDAVIIFPGMAAVNGFDGIRSFLNSAYTYIESGNALGGTDPDAYFDAVAWHMYYFSTSFTSENWLNGNNSIYQVMKDHGSEKGRHSWDPMLVLLALTGDEEKAGYRCVRGFASVDADTGANHFLEDSQGLHRYVVKVWKDEAYSQQINALL